jgi:hypothetical protein
VCAEPLPEAVPDAARRLAPGLCDGRERAELRQDAAKRVVLECAGPLLSEPAPQLVVVHGA